MTSNENPGGDDDYAGGCELVAAADAADVVGDSGDAADARHVAAAGGVAPVASELVADDATDAADVVGSIADDAAGGEPDVVGDDFVRLPNEVLSDLVARAAEARDDADNERLWHCLLSRDWRVVTRIDTAERKVRESAWWQRSYHCDGARLVVEFKDRAAAASQEWRDITRVMYRDADDVMRDWNWPDNIRPYAIEGGDVPPFLKRADSGGFLRQFNQHGWA